MRKGSTSNVAAPRRRASEERRRLAVSAARIGIWEWTIRERLVTWEGEKLEARFGVAELRCPTGAGTWLAALFHDADAARFERAIGDALEGGGALRFRARVRSSDAEIQWVELTGEVHRDASGTPMSFVGTAADVSTWKEVVDRLAKFRTMFEEGLQFSGILSPDGIVTEANRGSIEGCGHSRADTLGTYFWECGWWSSSREIAATMKEATLRAGTGVPFRAELPYFIGDGTERRADVILTPVKDKNRDVIFIAATGTDVTERARAEEKLRRTDERLKLFLENTRDYAVVITDVAGEVIEWQGGAEEITGYAPAEAIGRPCKALLGEPEHTNGALAVTLEKSAAGQMDVRRWCVRKDGTPFFAEGTKTALRNDRATLATLQGFAYVFRDATDKRRAEDALRESEERFRFLDAVSAATRAASDPGAVLGATLRMLGEALGVSRCLYADLELDGTHFTNRGDWNACGSTSMVGTYDLDAFGAYAASELRSGRTLVLRDVLREAGPSDVVARIMEAQAMAAICCPLVKEGRLVAFLAVTQSSPRNWTAEEVALVEQVSDRSWAHIERTRDAEELREQDRRKDEFLATLAHELRNPLAPLRAGLHVLKLANLGGDQAALETAEDARATMERQLGHLVRLVDDLLDISRISRGTIEPRKEEIELHAAIDHGVEASRAAIEAGGHTLVVRRRDRPLPLMGDMTRLAQVVTNLLNNAAKYTARGGHIELTASADGEDAVLTVRDDGNGISPENLPRVFDLFYQVKQSAYDSRGGLGIGLSLVKKLVALHGGSVIAESRGLGQGSTFTVRLPRIVEPALQPGSKARGKKSDDGDGAPARVPRPGAVPFVGPRPEKKRILVVDDNVDGAKMLTTLLRIVGYEARMVEDGPSALEEVQRFSPHVVFLDIGMPGMDGFEVARHLRKNARSAEMTLVALTGWGTPNDRLRTTEAGFDMHLIKPVEVDAIKRLLANLPPPRLFH